MALTQSNRELMTLAMISAGGGWAHRGISVLVAVVGDWQPWLLLRLDVNSGPPPGPGRRAARCDAKIISRDKAGLQLFWNYLHHDIRHRRNETYSSTLKSGTRFLAHIEWLGNCLSTYFVVVIHQLPASFTFVSPEDPGEKELVNKFT